MNQDDEWLTLAQARDLLAEHPLTKVSLRTLHKILADPDRRAQAWERETPDGREIGWATRTLLLRTEYRVKRSFVEEKIRTATDRPEDLG